MTQLALSIPQSGQPNSTEDVKIASDLTAIQSVVNGNLDSSNLTVATSNTWLRLASAGGVYVAYGTGTVTFSGGSPDSGAATVTHGLGRTPVAITVTGNSGTTTLAWKAVNRTGTTFQAGGKTVDGGQPAGGTTVGFDWVAIG